MLKKLIVGAALSLSTLAAAAPHDRGMSPRGPQSEVFDVQQGYRLLGEFDAAMARRDVRLLSRLDRRIARFVDAELSESRGDSGRLQRLQFTLSRLEGRFDPRALIAKRRVLAEAVSLAERDVPGAHRFSRR